MPTGDGLAHCLPIECLFSHHFADTYRKEPLFLGFLVDSTSSWISTCKLKKTPLKKALVLIRNCQHFLAINCMNWFDFLFHSLWSSKGDLSKHLWTRLSAAHKNWNAKTIAISKLMWLPGGPFSFESCSAPQCCLEEEGKVLLKGYFQCSQHIYQVRSQERSMGKKK